MLSEKEIEQLYWTIAREADEPENGDYTKYYTHIKTVFLEAVKRNYTQSEHKDKMEIPAFSENFIKSFLGNMQKITIRTLIFEMELCVDCEELKGGTDEEKYHDFADHLLLDPDYLKEIYKEYPLMYEDILRYLTLSAKNICEVLNRFETDIEEINLRFFKGNPCQTIVKIDGANSDMHNGGSTVLILELDQGEKLVYKPRSLAMDEAYRKFLLWTCENIDMPYWWNEVWNRGDYGWCGLVTSTPCKSDNEMKRYYERNGILLCVSYLLGSGDIHYENLIAHGEYPVVIDLELAVGSRGENISSDEEVRRVFKESVLQTGILPLYAWNEAGEGVNVGAMNGGGGQLLPLDIPVIVDAGTIRMHVEYRRPRLKEGKNLATLNGKFIQPTEFFSEIKGGFEKTYLFFEKNKEEVSEKLRLFQGVRARYLVRQTQEYSFLFTAMHHPNFLTAKKERSDLLCEKICCNANPATEENKWIHMQEVQEMERGDIPYFWYDPYASDLYCGNEICRDYFFEPVIKEVFGRLKRLKQSDRKRQEKLMRMALFLGEKPVAGENFSIGKKDFGTQKKTEINLSDAIAKKCGEGLEGLEGAIEDIPAGVLIAEEIGKILLNEAIWSDDRKNVGWISIIMAGYRERGYLIRPMGMYLYDGLAGIAIFMQRLARETGKKEYGEVAELLIQKLFAYTKSCMEKKQKGQKEQKEQKPTGAFSGEASIALAYLLLSLSDGRAEFLDYLKWQCEAMRELFSKDTHFDVLGGNAGAILVLLGAYEITGDQQYILWAKEAGEFLVKDAASYKWGLGWVNSLTNMALTGFAHGAGGIMLALAKLGYYSGDKRFLDAAYRAFLFEEHYFDERARDWKDLRFLEEMREEEKTNPTESMAWCHGWGGIVMARTLAGRYTGGEFQRKLKESSEAVLRQKEGTEKYSKGSNYCLCHGKYGNAALYFASQKEETSRKLEENIRKELMGYKGKLQDIFEMQECSNYGLMAGITGIGYSCLCGAEEVARILGIDFYHYR